jgi:hypothetical protein
MPLIAAGLAVLLVRLQPGAEAAGRPRVLARGAVFSSALRRLPETRRRDVSYCTNDNGSGYFVGIPAADEFAGGLDSGVASGYFTEACDSYSVVAGGDLNVIGNQGAATYSFVGSGYSNFITSDHDFIGGGAYNLAAASGAAIAGGGTEYYNVQGDPSEGLGSEASGVDAFIGAGDLNAVSGNGSVIGGGGYTYAATGATAAGNQISGTDSFIGAGDQNTISSNQGFIGAGSSNKISNNYATVGGGDGNDVSGQFGTIPGGEANTVGGFLGFAAGYHADTKYAGSFVWSDYVSGSSIVSDKAKNQFVVRASGGTVIYTNEAPTSGVQLAAGGGSWGSVSDRNAKTDIVPLDDESVLAKVVALPLSTWQYTSERGVRHVGPMAQDFYAAFGVGEDDRHITSIDEDGVALAAIKAVNAKLDHENLALRAANHLVQSRLTALEAKVAALTPRER